MDIVPTVRSKYDAIISEGVYSESESYYGNEFEVFKTHDARFEQVVKYIKKRHEGLGIGEISSIAVSLFLTENKIDNYIVTDDLSAREQIKKLHEDTQLKEIMGHEISPIKYTGTVGVILRLHECGLLSSADLRHIADDLEVSSFRITSNLLSMLRDQK